MNAIRDYRRVEQAIHYLAQHAREQPCLETVAAHVGLSAFHFQRLFQRWAGISPKRFLQYLTAERARELLRSQRSAFDASLNAGLSGGGRLHDLLIAIHAATPGAIKTGGAGMTIDYGSHPSPFGECFIAITDRGICALEFLSDTKGNPALMRLESAWSAATLRERPATTRVVAQQLFARRSPNMKPLHLFVRGTNFQIKVWEALLRIAPGRVVSYEEVAAFIGAPRATRAVASAVAQNAIGYLIPCHRVIRKSGIIGEYRWGTVRKQALLAWEATKHSD